MLQSLEAVSTILKNLYKIEMYEKYDEDASYAGKRGQHYVRGHYSYADSPMEGEYSRSSDRMTAQLREMMRNASGEKEREALARCIDTIDRM